MRLFTRIKHWIRRFFTKHSPEEILAGVSATPDHPEPVDLIAWLLIDYRPQLDRHACFALEHLEHPYVTIRYDEEATLVVHYTAPFSPMDRMKAIGLRLPLGFSVIHWEKHQHFVLHGPKLAPHTMAEFIDRLFITLYRAGRGYVLAGWTELEEGDAQSDNAPSQQAL